MQGAGEEVMDIQSSPSMRHLTVRRLPVDFRAARLGLQM
jgi:hypothetical protein